jgi:hypothetical protein
MSSGSPGSRACNRWKDTAVFLCPLRLRGATEMSGFKSSAKPVCLPLTFHGAFRTTILRRVHALLGLETQDARLPVRRGSLALGFAFKRTDARALTKGMRIALEVLRLEHLLVVRPGAATFPCALHACPSDASLSGLRPSGLGQAARERYRGWRCKSTWRTAPGRARGPQPPAAIGISQPPC